MQHVNLRGEHEIAGIYSHFTRRNFLLDFPVSSFVHAFFQGVICSHSVPVAEHNSFPFF